MNYFKHNRGKVLFPLIYLFGFKEKLHWCNHFIYLFFYLMIHNPDKDMRNKGSHIDSLVVKFQCGLGSRGSNYYLCLICEVEMYLITCLLLCRNCEIKSIAPYGVFVEIAPGREVYISSQFSYKAQTFPWADIFNLLLLTSIIDFFRNIYTHTMIVGIPYKVISCFNKFCFLSFRNDVPVVLA